MAAAMELVLKMQSETMCGICRIYFSQPVTTECGHSFCRECLSWSWRGGTSPFSCPECRQVCRTRKLPELNVALEKLSDKVRQLSSHFVQSTEEQSKCPIHQKVLKLFCEEDQMALCVLCSQTPEHKAHTLSPVAEAAHNYRRKLQGILNRVGKDFEEAKKLLSQVKKEMARPLVDWNRMIMGEYYNLHHFLMEEELQCLERLKEEQRTSKDRLSQHIHNLWEIMSDLQESRHKPIIELLKDFRELLGRSESVFSQSPKAVIPDLMEHPITGMIDILNKFRVDIRVNPQSASSYVIVSEDLKSMRAGEGWEMDPDHPENFACHFVSAEQAFSSGRQYWEVDVTQVPQWGLGIRTEHLRGGSNLDSFASVFLLCCVKKENNYYFQTCPGQLNYQIKDPVPRVGVYLEHTTGTLLFYNVVKRSLIYRFDPILFTELVTPIFSPGPPLPGTKVGPMTICPVNAHLCACCYSFL
ncbi:putative E3 ubiquitin-protein ligase TRIML1 [Phascolarctos cinereus]|uniref:Probable E3 ubiquitin-protein ligase TRIML1 n=1 Tax=Phascolarctos cinereus TaxID=38626 RepID=A0A6P5ITL6_PHACI|nr:probable E3 ubiquitin-protein ligase TRIML1 [Phascolarctos cinereus]